MSAGQFDRCQPFEVRQSVALLARTSGSVLPSATVKRKSLTSFDNFVGVFIVDRLATMLFTRSQRQAGGSSRGAGLRIPTRRVGSLFEMRTDDPGLAEILRITDLGYEREPLIAVRRRHQMIVLGEICVRAIGDAVLAGISRP